jgi:hypothetical protein
VRLNDVQIDDNSNHCDEKVLVSFLPDETEESLRTGKSRKQIFPGQ